MPIEMPRGLPFAVDTWGPSSRRRRHRFLTHAHRDHLVAAADSGECPGAVYATRLTLDLALRHFPRVKLPPPTRGSRFCSRVVVVGAVLIEWSLVVSQLERGEFVEMEVGKTVVVDDPAGAFSVTAYDANHCPGNSGSASSVLHTVVLQLTVLYIS